MVCNLTTYFDLIFFIQTIIILMKFFSQTQLVQINNFLLFSFHLIVKLFILNFLIL